MKHASPKQAAYPGKKAEPTQGKKEKQAPAPSKFVPFAKKK